MQYKLTQSTLANDRQTDRQTRRRTYTTTSIYILANKSHNFIINRLKGRDVNWLHFAIQV